MALFRIGVYILLAVLGLWVLRDSVLKSLAGYLIDRNLNIAGIVGFAVIGLGFITLIYEKMSTGPKKTKCKICKKPVLTGEYYCRVHLREIVDRASRDS